MALIRGYTTRSRRSEPLNPTNKNEDINKLKSSNEKKIRYGKIYLMK
jgi:hypothetical protein